MSDLYLGVVFRVVKREQDGTPYPFKILRVNGDEVAACPSELDAMMILRDLELVASLLHKREPGKTCKECGVSLISLHEHDTGVCSLCELEQRRHTGELKI